MKIEKAPRRIIRAADQKIPEKNLRHSDILQVNTFYTMFELYIVEVLKKLFKELRRELPLRVLQSNEPPKQCIGNCWASKGQFHLPTIGEFFCQIQKAYN